MYRVLLVDDENLTLDFLKMAIPKQDPDWEIAAACLDGMEAFEWLQSHTVDLILTDIKMPEMSGLELCQQIHLRNPEQKIVILSGHDEFKFAQQAIQYGVVDYLLKPISLTELKNTLCKIKSALQAERAEKLAYHSLLEMSEDGKKQIAAHFIQAMIENSNVEIKSLYPLIHRMKISLIEGAGIMMLLSLDEDVLLQNGIQARDIPLFRFILYRLTLEYTEQFAIGAWVTLDQEENTLLLLSADDTESVQALARQLYEKIAQLMREHAGLSISAGVSSLFYDVMEMETAYRQAGIALSSRLFCTAGTYYPMEKIASETQDKIERLNHYVSSLRSALLDKNSMAQQLALQAIIQLMPNQTEAEALRFGLYWVKELSKAPQAWPSEKINRAITALYTYKSSSQNTIQELFTHTSALFSSSEVEKSERGKSENSIVSQAEHFIHTNYAQPISLALVAEKIDVSPNYLSSLFHKELGESYSKYVTRVRMEHAKRLMKENPGIRIYEIVNKVGYISVKHFSYVFKQLFGVTPGEYQQSLKTS